MRLDVIFLSYRNKNTTHIITTWAWKYFSYVGGTFIENFVFVFWNTIIAIFQQKIILVKSRLKIVYVCLNLDSINPGLNAGILKNSIHSVNNGNKINTNEEHEVHPPENQIEWIFADIGHAFIWLFSCSLSLFILPLIFIRNEI